MLDDHLAMGMHFMTDAFVLCQYLQQIRSVLPKFLIGFKDSATQNIPFAIGEIQNT